MAFGKFIIHGHTPRLKNRKSSPVHHGLLTWISFFYCEKLQQLAVRGRVRNFTVSDRHGFTSIALPECAFMTQ